MEKGSKRRSARGKRKIAQAASLRGLQHIKWKGAKKRRDHQVSYRGLEPISARAQKGENYQKKGMGEQSQAASILGAENGEHMGRDRSVIGNSFIGELGL